MFGQVLTLRESDATTEVLCDLLDVRTVEAVLVPSDAKCEGFLVVLDL